jgi:hypothetical protein
VSVEASLPTPVEKAEPTAAPARAGLLARTVGRLDDLLNPIVVKELRQAVKSRIVVTGLLVLLVFQLFVIGLYLAFRTSDRIDLTLGSEIFLVLQGILVGTCLLLIPAYAGIRIAAERSDTNVDLLFISTLKPGAILRGKFLSATVLTLIIFSACAPFMTFTYLLRGLDIPTILFVLGADFLAVLGGTMLMLFLGAVPTNWPLKVALFLPGLVALGCLFAATMSLATMLLQVMGGVPLEMPEFWAGALGVGSVYLGLVGLFFVWSVAVISPPSTNRMLPVRLFMLLQWVVTGAASAFWSRTVDHHGPVQLWLMLTTVLFALQIVISINEREAWGSRVSRKIPRKVLLRPLAFLFYSGSAGGLAFSVLMILATFVAAGLWHEANPMIHGHNEAPAPFLAAALIAGYTLAYSLTAVQARAWLFRRHIRPVYTWVLALLFLGLGCTLPFIAAYLVYFNEFRFPHETEWWLWANPFNAVYEALDKSWSDWNSIYFRVEDTILVVSAWCVLVVVASVPWFLGQVRGFGTSERSQ